MVVSGEVSTLAYLIVVGILVVSGALISLLGSSKTFTEKMIDEPVDRSDRDEWNDRGFGGF
jgi:predicted benzoate:H+ symporter BenE